MFEGLESRWLLASDAFEPNNDFDDASDLGTGSQFVDDLTIDPAGDLDFFEWTASGDGAVVIDLWFAHSDNHDLVLELYSSTRSLLEMQDTATDNERIVWDVASGESYFIKVYEFNGFDHPGYTLELTESVPDAFEPNDDDGSATNLGSSDQTLSDLSIHRSTDNDWYEWTSPVDGDLAIDLFFSHAKGDIDVLLLDSGLEEVAASESSDDNEHIDYSVGIGETFFIHIFGSEGDVQPEYELAVEATAPPTITGLPIFATAEVGVPKTISFTVDDPDTPLGALTLIGESDDQAVVPDGSFSFGGSGNSRTVTMTPLAAGSANITIEVVDDDFLNDSDGFLLVVSGPPVDDPPEVVEVVVSGGSWGLPPISLGVAQQAPLPWAGLDRIDVVFSEDVDVVSDSLTLAGVNVLQYGPSTFNYSAASATATWTFPTAIGADKLLLNLAGEATDPNAIDEAGPGGQLLNDGADFNLRIDMLPGDASRDGLVSVTDLVNVASRIGENAGPPPTSDYLERVDINADGLVSVTDLVNVGSRIGNALPSGEPTPPSSLLVANGARRLVAQPELTFSAELDAIVQEAVHRLADAGLSARESELLSRTEVQVVDLPGDQLGAASQTVIQIDVSGAGYAWFVDATPDDDREFGQIVAETERRAEEESEAYGRVDLLTVVMHELTHILGREHSVDPFDLMAETLATGVRRVPAAVDAVLADSDPLVSCAPGAASGT